MILYHLKGKKQMKKKKEPAIKIPKIEILPSGAAHTRVVVNGERISITKDTEAECISEYLALKHGVKIAEEKKRRIKKAALKEFARVPLEEISINRIIRDAEIPRGSFYQYFEDKQDAINARREAEKKYFGEFATSQNN